MAFGKRPRKSWALSDVTDRYWRSVMCYIQNTSASSKIKREARRHERRLNRQSTRNWRDEY